MNPLLDITGKPHVFTLETALIDGRPCTTLELDSEGNQLRLVTEQGMVTCTFDQFWRATAGLDPTPTEAGRLLAQCFAQQILLVGMLTELQSIDALLNAAIERMQTCGPLSLGWLQRRLDPFIRRSMAAYDGSEAMTLAIARILGQTPETIRIWAVELGYEAAPLLASASAAQANEAAETDPPLFASVDEALAGAETKEIFRWTEDRLEQLEEGLVLYAEGTVVARSQQIADRYGWPVEKVRSKLYFLQKPVRQSREQRSGRETKSNSTSQEGD